MKHQRCDASGRSMKAYNMQQLQKSRQAADTCMNSSCHGSKQAADSCMNSSCHGSKQAADSCMNSSCHGSKLAGSRYMHKQQLPWKKAGSRCLKACRELMHKILVQLPSRCYMVAEIQAVVQKIQGVVLKPRKIMLTISWA